MISARQSKVKDILLTSKKCICKLIITMGLLHTLLKITPTNHSKIHHPVKKHVNSEHMKRYSTSFFATEIQIIITMRFHWNG